MTKKLFSPLSSLKEFIDTFIKNSDTLNLETRRKFLNIFASAILEINRQQYLYSLDTASLQKSNNLKNVCLNWLMEFMGMIKSIANNEAYSTHNVTFALEIFFVYIYCLSFKSADLYNSRLHGLISVNSNQILADLRFYLHKLMKQTHWKQIHKILVDWFISLFRSRNFPTEIGAHLKGI